MSKIAYDIFDLVIVVLLISLCISLSFTDLYRTRKDVIEQNQIFEEDKNTGKTKGYLVTRYNSYDGTLSKLEVVLMSQIQDVNMPYPREITVNNLNIDVPITYKDKLFECAQNVWLGVRKDTIDTRYSVDYKFELSEDGTIDKEYFEVLKR